MIELGTLAGLHARDHELHAFCVTGDRWSVLPLARMIADGMGQRRCRCAFAVVVRGGRSTAGSAANAYTQLDWLDRRHALSS